MRALSAGELLSVWERAAALGPLDRSLMLLAAATPGEPLDDLLQLALDERDRRLLELRELTFGQRLECQLTCPVNGEELELTLSTRELRRGGASPDGIVSGDTTSTGLVEHDGWRVRFRLPRVCDLVEASRTADGLSARNTLLARSVRSVAPPRSDELPGLPEAGLPREVEAALLAEMARRDEAASVMLGLHCPGCGHDWQTRFDVLSFLWTEIDTWAQGTLREVHLLASAYGWCEADVLALSPWRRRTYLQMCGHA
jgi:hypothetical protein